MKLTSAAALTVGLGESFQVMAGPFEPEDTADHFVPADKKLQPDWLARLFAKGSPDWYAGADLDQIAMPIGGICAGQLYLSGDGTLKHWDIFNDSEEDARPGTHYQKLPPEVREVRQGFAIHCRTRKKSVTRKLDRSGFPEVRFRGEYPIGRVEYLDPEFPVRICLEAFSPFIPLNAEDSALPATVMNFTIENGSEESVEVSLAGHLENAVCCRTADVVEIMRENRRVTGENVAGVVGTAREIAGAQAPEREPLILADFEKGTYGEWQSEGEAFGSRPAGGTLAGQQEVSGFQGQGLVNSFTGGDKPHGKLTSPEFKIDRTFLNFLIGGGSYAGRTCINLLVNGRKVRTETGRDNERLVWRHWRVEEFMGEPARIEIVDAESGGWGHINIDQIELDDRPRRGEKGPVTAQPDYGSMGLFIVGSPAGWFEAADLRERSLVQFLEAGPHSTSSSAEKTTAKGLIGAVGRRVRLRPGQRVEIPFLIAWHFPNRPRHGNQYGVRFANATEVADYAATNFERLAGATRLWRDTWYGSTLPCWLLDRLFSTTSILATATCHWRANGRFWGWEGVRCCAGTCAHVWNYEHAMARLFPGLELSVREMQDFGAGFVEATGAINFRGESNDFWAGDSQGGTALKCLREFQMSGDRRFLERNWPRIKKSVEFLIQQDADDDGLIEGSQHNTYDINFFGANTMVGSLYLGALRAADELARELGETEFARRCEHLCEAGGRHTVEQLFNGEYFIQKVDLAKHPEHQYGEGCLADQLFGQGWAHQVGLGYLYPKDKVRSALKAIWTYNWAPDIGPQNAAHPPQRWFARPGEAGLFVCTWPKSQHLGPRSVLYRDEIWTGIEYQVAGHMVWEGMLTEALAICRGIHERYHPARQNPWNEVECGDHYARAMASYGVFLALCGFECNGPRGLIGFAPKITPEDFQAAFTAAESWGAIHQRREVSRQTNSIRVRHGRLKVRVLRFELPEQAVLGTASLRVNGRSVAARSSQEGAKITLSLESETHLVEGGVLEATITWA